MSGTTGWRQAAAVLGACLLPALAGLAAAPSAAGAQEAVAVARPIAPDASIKIWNGGGSVRVVGRDADSLTVAGEVAAVAGGRFFLRAEEDVAKLGVEGDQAEVRGRLEVGVPRGATVWIRTSSADVTVEGLTGGVDVHTAAGAIEARGRPETFYAESMSGDLELRLEADIVRARAGTGGIRFTGSARDLTLDGVDGPLEVSASGLRRGRFSTVKGAIDFTGGVPRAGALSFETHSGDVRLALPGGVGADVRLSTLEGRIEVDHPGAPDADRGTGRRSAEFELGDGGSEVEVRTFSGSVTVVGGG